MNGYPPPPSYAGHALVSGRARLPLSAPLRPARRPRPLPQPEAARQSGLGTRGARSELVEVEPEIHAKRECCLLTDIGAVKVSLFTLLVKLNRHGLV